MEYYKICMIYPGRFPTIGGAETLAYELINSLLRKGNIVYVISSSSSISYQGKIRNLHVLPILRAGKVGFLKNFLSLFKLFLRERFDLIHAHFAFPQATWGITGKLFRIPMILTSHGADIQKDKSIGYGIRLNKIFAIITWLTLKLVDVHVVVSKSMIKDAVEAGSKLSKIRVIYNGIDLKKIQLLGGTNILQRYSITNDDFIILYLGRLHPKKCPDDLLKALPKVVQKVPNAKLIIAGKGSEREKLEKLALNLNLEGKVIFTGFVSEDEKWDLLKRCDIFVLPSIIEAFGISVIEALACGKPVIATNIGPFPEIIRSGETGLLVPVHSSSDLANAIIELALNEDKREKMGKIARKDVEERFDINKIADRYLEIYEELVNKNVRILKENGRG